MRKTKMKMDQASGSGSSFMFSVTMAILLIVFVAVLLYILTQFHWVPPSLGSSPQQSTPQVVQSGPVDIGSVFNNTNSSSAPPVAPP